MQVFGANISDLVLQFFSGLFAKDKSYYYVNQVVEDVCGCKRFFPVEDKLTSFQDELNTINGFCCAEERSEYGDFQTNRALTKAVTEVLSLKGIAPEVVIEPTCGKGNFILAALDSFPSVKQIIGVEIYEPYVWECKFNIVDYFLNHPDANKPSITIFHSNVFGFDFIKLKKQIQDKNLLVLGNPPWVTNSMLGALESDNLPYKSNFKKQKGIDAITGKGNFDIAEYIVLLLMKLFEKSNGYLSLLVKNSVIKNVVYEQNKNRYHISDIEEMNIDSRKEFNVSVDASLLLCRFNAQPSLQCQVSNFYDGNVLNQFGWVGNSFYSDIQNDRPVGAIDGKCPMEWRQGIKHDCSSVMELERDGNMFRNKLDEIIDLEENLVYGLLKSSDLKSFVAHKPKKYIIVTQQNVGQKTDYIIQYPKTYDYLQRHLDLFRNRKSTIYKKNPDFSIFGIGDYSFKPYKVAISGLYKTLHFTLVLPDQKPVMLDDTCYFLGFDDLKSAVAVHAVLNSDEVRSFLQSVTFSDAKRMITKEVLMRIDFAKVMKVLDSDTLIEQANQVLSIVGSDSKLDVKDFAFISQNYNEQLELF